MKPTPRLPGDRIAALSLLLLGEESTGVELRRLSGDGRTTVEVDGQHAVDVRRERVGDIVRLDLGLVVWVCLGFSGQIGGHGCLLASDVASRFAR